MVDVPRDFRKELLRRYAHLECEWMPHGYFLGKEIRNRFVVWERDRRGWRWQYMVVENPTTGAFREPGGWVFNKIQRDDMGRDFLTRDARKRWINSLEKRDDVDKRTEKRNAKWKDKLGHEIKDKAYFTGNQKRVHNRNKLEGVR